MNTTQISASASARPSVGGRLGAKPTSHHKEVYSFPMLPLDEIVEVLREMGVVVSEDDLLKPKPDVFRHWCELFVIEILSISKEEIYQPARSCVAYLGGSDELHDDSIPVVHFLRKTNKVLMAARCDEGLSLRDVMKPEKQRVQRVLSALINLFKFRSEKLPWYEENLQKKEASVSRRQELMAQIEHLQQAIASEMRARESEQPEIEAVYAQTKALEAQRDELTAQAQSIRSVTDGQKETIKALKDQAASLHRTADDVRAAVDSKKAQIVSSPAKVKAEVAGLQSVVEAEQAAVDGLDAEKRLLSRQLEVVAKAHKDVTKSMVLMGEAEGEAVKLKRVLRDEKGRKVEAEALGGEVEGLRVQLEHAELVRRRAEEKVVQVKEEGFAQLSAQARALDAIHSQSAEYSDEAKLANNARRGAENEKMRLEAKKEQLIAKHSAEVGDMLASVKHLSSAVQGYHGTLFANLSAVNAMAPVGTQGQWNTTTGAGL